MRFLIITCAFLSCSSKKIFDFNYNKDKTSYINNVNCLRTNYSVIWRYLNSTEPIYYSPSGVTEHAVCGYMYNIIKNNSIDMISFERDSTVSFYSPTGHSSNDKQLILMFITRNIKIQDKITPNLKLLQRIDSNCYELEINNP